MTYKVKATIVQVLSHYGNRVYRLATSEPIGKSECVRLSLEEHEDQKNVFPPNGSSYIIDNMVSVAVHNCTDLANEIGKDAYYAWQPRQLGKPSACSRCKARMDIVRKERAINP